MLYKRMAHAIWYPWLVAVLAMLVVAVSNGLVNTGLSVFDESLLDEFGWSVGVLKTKDAISFLCGAIFVLGAGYFVDKYGPKPMLLIGLALLAGGYYFYSYINSLTQLYTMHIVFGMVIGCAGNMTAVVTAASWAKNRRGLATGIVIAGTSVGGFFVPPIANALNEQFGWRISMQVEAVIPIALFILVLLVIKNRIARKQEPSADSVDGMPFSQVVKQIAFYQVAIAGALTYFAVMAMFSHMFLYMRSLDFSSAQASYALSLMALTAFTAKIFVGFISDYVNPYRLFKIQMMVMLIGVLGVSQMNQFIWVFLVLVGLGWGGLHTLYNYILITLFGLRDLGKVNSIVSLAEALGAAAGIKYTGDLYDYFGNYPSALLVAGGLMVIATLCILPIKKPMEQVR